MTWTRTLQKASRRAEGGTVVLHPSPGRSLVRRRRNLTMTKPQHVATSATAADAEGTIQYLLENNRSWADAIRKDDPELFPRLAKQQTPKFLWIGCADSRVPANQVLGLQPGEVFVQRNVGNLATHKDMNCMACLEYAVTALKVEHVIVCGHRECGAVKAALTMPATTPGLVNLWISDIRDVRNNHEGVLKKLDMDARTNRLCEYNVIRQVFNVCTSPVVQAAWKSGQKLAIHGLVYNVHDGHLKELTAPITGLAELAKYEREMDEEQPRAAAGKIYSNDLMKRNMIMLGEAINSHMSFEEA